MMSVLFHFDTVDTKATARQVREFFKSDVSELEYRTNATLSGLLRSPKLDGIANHSNTNGTETAVIDGVDAKHELSLIVESIENCTAFNRRLLELRYIERQKVWQIEQTVGYGHQTVCEKLNEACVNFATQYSLHGRDLRVFKHKQASS